MDYNGHLHFIRYGNLGLGQRKNFTADLHIGVNQFDQGRLNYVPGIDLGPPKTHACSWWRHIRCLYLERSIVKYPWAEIWYIPFFFCSKNYIRIIFAGVLFRTVGCDWYTYLYPLYFSSFLKNSIVIHTVVIKQIRCMSTQSSKTTRSRTSNAFFSLYKTAFNRIA